MQIWFSLTKLQLHPRSDQERCALVILRPIPSSRVGPAMNIDSTDAKRVMAYYPVNPESTWSSRWRALGCVLHIGVAFWTRGDVLSTSLKSVSRSVKSKSNHKGVKTASFYNYG